MFISSIKVQRLGDTWICKAGALLPVLSIPAHHAPLGAWGLCASLLVNHLLMRDPVRVLCQCQKVCNSSGKNNEIPQPPISWVIVPVSTHSVLTVC